MGNAVQKDRVDWRKILVLFTIGVVSAVLRISHFQQLPVDRLDESYYHWLIEVLTIRNGGVYSDLPPMPNWSVVWLPLYHYVTIMGMTATGDFSITVPRLTSLAFGSVTPVVAALLGYGVTRRWMLGFAAGLLLAFQPWHINFSTLGTDESLITLLFASCILAFFARRFLAFAILSVLLFWTSYEGWIIIILLLIAAYRTTRWPTRKIIFLCGTLALSLVVWSTWAYVASGSPVSWATTYLTELQFRPRLSFAQALFYVSILQPMTAFVALIAVVIGAIYNRRARFVSALTVVYLLVLSLASSTGLDPGTIARVVPLLPLLAVATSPVVSIYQRGSSWRLAAGALLVVLIAVPYGTQIEIGIIKAFIIPPEQRVGERLRAVYSRGVILTDQATVIYFSQIDPRNFMSPRALDWFMKSGDTAMLANWVQRHNVAYFVWYNNTDFRSHLVLYELGTPKNYNPMIFRFGRVEFVLVYEDSFEVGFPEHNPDYLGPPAIFLYSIRVTP